MSVFKRLFISAALTLLMCAPLYAQSPTAVQLLEQIKSLVQQLESLMTPVTVANVSTTEALTAALASGGTVNLGPGIYVGNFVIMKPTTLSCDSAATLTNKDGLSPTLQVSADDVTVTNCHVNAPSDPSRETLVVGSLAATTTTANPHRVKLIGLTVQAGPKGGRRGVALHGSDLTLDHSSVLGYSFTGQDAQGVWILNGPGPYTVTNNTIEGSGENILVGGDDPKIPGVIPSNILIQANVFNKPDAWRSMKNTVKNSIELKTGQHVKILDNVITGWWRDGQYAPVQFTTRNQNGGCTWCVVDDVLLQYNVFHTDAAGFAVNILGADDTNPSGQTDTIIIDHNYWPNVSEGFQILNGVRTGLTITNNTLPAITGRMFSFDFPSANQPMKIMTPLVFSKNVLKTGQYGVAGDGTEANSLASLLAYAVVNDFTGNIIELTNVRPIPLPIGSTLLPFGGLAALLNPTTGKLLAGGAGY